MDIHLHSDATFNIVSYLEVHQIGAGLKGGLSSFSFQWGSMSISLKYVFNHRKTSKINLASEGSGNDPGRPSRKSFATFLFGGVTSA